MSAPVKNKSHTIETTLDLKGDEQGVIVACGGMNGGYTLFIADHKLHYDYNFFNIERTRSSRPRCPRAKSTSSSTSSRRASFKGTGELYVNGKKVAEAPIDKTVPGPSRSARRSTSASTTARPVSNNYKVKDHFPFTGAIDKVTINLLTEGPDQPPSVDVESIID